MKANYHTHTVRCRHASGTEREYIRNALRGGMELLGFSDHTPYDYSPSSYRSAIRMDVGELQDYVTVLQGLKKEYAGRIDVRIGLEVEYYPDLFYRLLETSRQAGVEYMIQGQHFLGNEEGSPYAGKATDDERILDRYVSQTVEGLQTGAFSCLAHPDLMHFTGPEAVYVRHMRRLCRAARDLSVPLEINLLGIRDSRHYPRELFWRVAGEEGNDVILGADAHQPEAVCCPSAERAAEELAARCGLRMKESMALLDIRKL